MLNRLGTTGSSTPARLRLLAILTVLAIVVIGAIAWFLADGLVDDTNQIEQSTGEVLIINQQVNASFAEAHAAAVSVHLSGARGDNEQRRLYEVAIERAASGLERVAAVAGDEPEAQASLEQIAALTTRYVGLIESARAGSIARDINADATLAQATDLTRNQISPLVNSVTERFQDRFDQQTQGALFLVALGAGLLLVVILGVAQLWLARRFRRLINPPLVLATIAVLAWVVFGAFSFFNQATALDRADDEAYESVRIGEQVQQLAYEHRAVENSLVLAQARDTSALDELRSAANERVQALSSVADNDRERAVTTEIETRWERYLAESDQVSSLLETGRTAGAELLTRGSANDAFNGFNAAAEANLLDNRDQFETEVAGATDAVRWLRWVIAVATVVAGLAAWWGYSLRMAEYR